MMLYLFFAKYKTLYVLYKYILYYDFSRQHLWPFSGCVHRSTHNSDVCVFVTSCLWYYFNVFVVYSCTDIHCSLTIP